MGILENKPRLKAIIIHLDRALERRKNIKKLVQQLPCPAEIIPAVDCQKLGPETVNQVYRRQLYHPKYPFVLSLNEIACFLSHRRAWQYIVENDLDYGLIIEDDVRLLSEFELALNLALNNVDIQSFIRFPFCERETGLLLAQVASFRLIKPNRVGLGQVAQLVGREAAHKLLMQTETFDRPVDNLMQLFWQTSIHPLCVLPGCVEEISSELGGSLLKQKHKLHARLQREVLRPIYRWQIKRLSRRRFQ